MAPKSHDEKGVTDRKQGAVLEFGVIEFAMQPEVMALVILLS